MKSAFSAAATAMISLSCLLVIGGAARAATDVPEPAMTEKPAIVLALEAAVADLEMPSETDAPFQVIYFAAPDLNALPAPDAAPVNAIIAVEPEETPLALAQIAKLIGAPADAALETRDLDEFFENATTEEEWMNAEEKATAARFAALLQLLKTQLKDAQVVVWGEAKKNVAIIGKCEGGAAGVTTLIVET